MKKQLLLLLCLTFFLPEAAHGTALFDGDLQKTKAAWRLTGNKGNFSLADGVPLLTLTTQLRHGRNKATLSRSLAELPEGSYKITGLVQGPIDRFYLTVLFSKGTTPGRQLLQARFTPAGGEWQTCSFDLTVPGGNRKAVLIFEPHTPKPETLVFKNFSIVKKTQAAPQKVKKAVAPAPVPSRPAPAGKGLKITAPMVARPAAAAGVVWPRFNIDGKDWHLMLATSWRTMKGLSSEAFVQGAGYGEVGTPFSSSGLPRKTGIREIEIWQGGKNVAPDSKITFSSTERATLFHHPERFNDGKMGTVGWIVGSLEDFRYINKGVPFRMDVELPAAGAVEKIVIHTISGSQPVSELRALFNGREPGTFSEKEAHGITLKFPQTPAVRNFRLTGKTRQMIYRVRDLDPQLVKAIGSKPFTHHHFLFRGKHAELAPENIDRDSLDSFRKKYPNFVPETVAEITANFYQHRTNPQRFRSALEKEGSIGHTYDRNRYEAAATLRKNYERYVDLFGKTNILEGGLPTMPYYYEWGAPYCSYEAMNERANWSNRFALLFGRSGSRQYNRPWGFYQTVYGEGTSANSRYSEKEAHRLAKIKNRRWHPGEDFGCSPSYTKRIIYYAYYCGTNMQHFESEPYGYAKHDPQTNTWRLTGHGRSIKDLYDWSVRKEGKRGTFYAPVLLLTDYYSANWEMKNYQQWNVWYMYKRGAG